MINGFFFDLWMLGISAAVAATILIARAIRHRMRHPWWRPRPIHKFRGREW